MTPRESSITRSCVKGIAVLGLLSTMTYFTFNPMDPDRLSAHADALMKEYQEPVSGSEIQAYLEQRVDKLGHHHGYHRLMQQSKQAGPRPFHEYFHVEETSQAQ